MGDSLAGRVAIVTGAGRGIGAAVAQLFAAEGAKVVVNDFGVDVDGSSPDAGPAGEVVAAIKAAGGEAVANGGDVGDFKQAEEMIQQAVDTYGQLDVLVNVAGILRDRMVFNLSEDDWDSVIRVHLKGTFNTVRHASAYWRGLRNEDGNFRVINFTSGAGIHGGPTQPNYSAAKAGIIGFTYSCANALTRYGVTSNAIGPAAATRMTGMIPEGGLGIADDDPFMQPQNIGPATAYVASERSGWLNGQVIAVYGRKIVLYARPDYKSLVTSPAQWTVESATEMMEDVFPQAVKGPVDPYGGN